MLKAEPQKAEPATLYNVDERRHYSIAFVGRISPDHLMGGMDLVIPSNAVKSITETIVVTYKRRK